MVEKQSRAMIYSSVKLKLYMSLYSCKKQKIFNNNKGNEHEHAQILQ